MKNFLERLFLIGGTGLALIPQICAGQSIPVPEYFGVYAVVEGRLLKLDGKDVRTENNIVVRIGQRNAIGQIVQRQPAARPPVEVSVPEFPADLKIVIYAESSGGQAPGDIAKSLHLESLAFVRNLTIESGWPSNIRRIDPENGWDAGDAAELGGSAGGDHARELEFLVKPMPGQPNMVIVGLAGRLSPGVYRLSIGERGLYAPAGGILVAVSPVAQGESGKCVDATISYTMSAMSNTKYQPCGAVSSGSVPPPDSAPEGRRVKSTAGERADPTTDVWDQALARGESISLRVCRDRGGLIVRPCEEGTLSLSAKEILFTQSDGRKLFGLPPAQVKIKAATSGPMAGIFQIEIGGKATKFQFVPTGIECPDRMQAFFACPDEGLTQQVTVAKYLARLLPKLVSGK